MLVTCELCSNEFLTESDPHVVRPIPKGYKIYCMCQIRGFEEIKQRESVMESLKEAIESMERLAAWELNETQTGISMKLEARESLQRIMAKLHSAGIRPGANRIE